ncbi:hypothetical protein OE88DRAFT_1106087 [Heliocybe sulcata]|uniref:Uncharacterized protein n=1 Tax=Heliocybe sulcata TaxID=5364 RepID=A0A5C3MLQ9_9AGAM|nr:hypothetical protein OE88DRAFT_1106087 [Heliocybe sulcata]
MYVFFLRAGREDAVGRACKVQCHHPRRRYLPHAMLTFPTALSPTADAPPVRPHEGRSRLGACSCLSFRGWQALVLSILSSLFSLLVSFGLWLSTPCIPCTPSILWRSSGAAQHLPIDHTPDSLHSACLTNLLSPSTFLSSYVATAPLTTHRQKHSKLQEVENLYYNRNTQHREAAASPTRPRPRATETPTIDTDTENPASGMDVDPPSPSPVCPAHPSTYPAPLRTDNPNARAPHALPYSTRPYFDPGLPPPNEREDVPYPSVPASAVGEDGEGEGPSVPAPPPQWTAKPNRAFRKGGAKDGAVRRVRERSGSAATGGEREGSASARADSANRSQTPVAMDGVESSAPETNMDVNATNEAGTSDTSPAPAQSQTPTPQRPPSNPSPTPPAFQPTAPVGPLGPNSLPAPSPPLLRSPAPPPADPANMTFREVLDEADRLVAQALAEGRNEIQNPIDVVIEEAVRRGGESGLASIIKSLQGMAAGAGVIDPALSGEGGVGMAASGSGASASTPQASKTSTTTTTSKPTTGKAPPKPRAPRTSTASRPRPARSTTTTPRPAFPSAHTTPYVASYPFSGGGFSAGFGNQFPLTTGGFAGGATGLTYDSFWQSVKATGSARSGSSSFSGLATAPAGTGLVRSATMPASSVQGGVGESASYAPGPGLDENTS